MNAAGANCPVCGAAGTRTFLSRYGVPTQQHLLLPDESAARTISRGDLELAVCPACGFVFNRAFDPARFAYDAAYDNNQACSPAFLSYMDSLIDYLVNERGAQNARIVEIGCGSGLFLTKLVAASPGARGVGFDPSYTGPLEALAGRVQFAPAYFSPSDDIAAADIVICRHVIEHIADPVGLLRQIRAAAPKARLFFETPDVEWILRGQVVWDFFYEHCSYFAPGSAQTAFTAAGYQTPRIRRLFHDQYLWIEAEPADELPNDAAQREPGDLEALAERFGAREPELLQQWRELAQNLRRAGPVALWGAGAKGVTFANLVDPEQRWLACVVDLNPRKQGKFLPGSGHPIVDFKRLPDLGVKSALLMNPNYHHEVAAALATLTTPVQLIDLAEQQQ